MNEKGSEYARVRIATYIIVHRKGAERSGEEKVIMGSVESFFGQRGEDMIGSDSKNAEPR